MAHPTRESADGPQAVEVVECSHCGLFQRLPSLGPDDVARCPQCDALQRNPRNNFVSLFCACAAAVLYVFALSLPFLTLRAAGRVFFGSLFTGPDQLRELGMGPLAGLVIFTLFIAPAVKITILVVSLGGERLAHPPRWLPWTFGWLNRIAPWAMVEVFLLGTFVAYTRLRALATVDIGPGLIALCGVMLTLVAVEATIDRHAIWYALERGGARRAARRDRKAGHAMGCLVCDRVSKSSDGEMCSFCGHVMHRRKPNSLQRTWALMIAAALLYIPANLFPVMTVTRFGRGSPHTILGGVVELFEDHMWPLGLVVFIASIVVPIAKIVTLVTMLTVTHKRSKWHLVHRAKAYRVISAIGRWSMIDIFALTVLVALVRMGFLATITPGNGAIAFAGVVVLTMLATESFDPRLMWDAPGQTSHARDRVPAIQPSGVTV